MKTFFQKLVESNSLMTSTIVKDTLDLLKGAVTIVYPMGLPPHDPIKMEFDNVEELAGKVAFSISTMHRQHVSVNHAAVFNRTYSHSQELIPI